MRKARFWRLAVIITTAGGLSAAGAGTALAGGAAQPGLGVTIGTASAFVQVTHDTLVRYAPAPDPAGAATVSGSVTGIPAGQAAATVTLLAEPFGAAAFAATGTPLTVPRGSDGSATYSFSVRPDLATSYEVQVSATAHSAPLRTSAAATVYVIPDVTVTGSTACARPTCTGDLVVTARYPAAAFAAESLKHLRLYGGLRKSPDGTPAEPATLHLSGTANNAVPNPALDTVQYKVGYEFNVGTEGYQWKVNYCTPDTEARDGIGLPGQHGCGKPTVSSAAPYLG
jgi:hypothetical protein